eukprot:SAG22_NODE_175_length_16235_cov_67.112729_10_plen_185_part_00
MLPLPFYPSFLRQRLSLRSVCLSVLSVLSVCLSGCHRAVFERVDADGSGLVDRDEIAEIGENLGLGWGANAEAAAVLAEMDGDGDGEIDFDEFFGWLQVRACGGSGPPRAPTAQARRPGGHSLNAPLRGLCTPPSHTIPGLRLGRFAPAALYLSGRDRAGRRARGQDRAAGGRGAGQVGRAGEL